MRWLLLLLLLAGIFPWAKAWFAVQKSSLAHALAWTMAAWASWAALPAVPEGDAIWTYLALCFTACAGVAVLGARRPHVAAWNFVVAGLLAVLALPLLENQVLGSRPIGALRMLFLAATLLIVLGNYVPTCFAPAAVLAMLACAGQMSVLLLGPDVPAVVPPASLLAAALVPWAGWGSWVLRRRPLTELERRWLEFRDRFGAMWSLRVREQFNRAADNAAWPMALTWSGVAPKPTSAVTNISQEEMTADFRALIKRFGADEAKG